MKQLADYLRMLASYIEENDARESPDAPPWESVEIKRENNEWLWCLSDTESDHYGRFHNDVASLDSSI